MRLFQEPIGHSSQIPLLSELRKLPAGQTTVHAGLTRLVENINNLAFLLQKTLFWIYNNSKFLLKFDLFVCVKNKEFEFQINVFAPDCVVLYLLT